MIHEPNTTEWKIGDLVIHDCDAKEADYLMVVIGYDPIKNLYHTRYVSLPRKVPKKVQKQIWKNDVKYLHDPERFGIKTDNNSKR